MLVKAALGLIGLIGFVFMLSFAPGVTGTAFLIIGGLSLFAGGTS
jgi:hypothetical protein